LQKYASDHNLEEIIGGVAASNLGMLAPADRLGFSERVDLEGADLRVVGLGLQ
jgi:hypothetical protein